MLAVRTPGASQAARYSAVCDSAFPFTGQGRLLRSRSISGLFSRSLHSGLQPPCLRFATAVTGRHARLGSRLPARLCRGRHLRRQFSTRLQGATRSDPCERDSRTRLPPWVSDGEPLVRLSVCAPAPVTRLSGSAPGPCFAGSHSPWSPPLAPPAPLRSGPLCSSASQLLWQSLTSRDRASSATAPRLPDADRRPLPSGRSRDLPVPVQGASAHARVSDHAGSS
jgi:hypothetical protein